MDDVAMIRRAVVGLVLFILGTFAGVYAERISTRPKPEPHAAEVKQADESVILERNPERPAPTTPKIPRGSKVTRITTATIAPTEQALNQNDGAITVQLTQIQAQDGTTRVIASTDDGQVIGGSDWTTPRPEPPRIPRWEVQALRTWQNGRGAAWGASLAYSRGPWSYPWQRFRSSIRSRPE